MEPTCCLCSQVVGESAYTGQRRGSCIRLIFPYELGYTARGQYFYDGCRVCRKCAVSALSQELPNPKRNFIRAWEDATACAHCRQLYQKNTFGSGPDFTIAHYCSSSFSSRNPEELRCGYESMHDGDIYKKTKAFDDNVYNALENKGKGPATICDFCIEEWVRAGWLIWDRNYI